MIEDNEIYGPALTKAIELEKREAEYPRFVVGDELLEFLESVKNQDPNTELGEWAKQAAVRCRRMIMQDTDGRQMLDFLCPEVRAVLDASSSTDFVAEGYDFAENEYKRFQRAGDEKLASRYSRLLQYYLARK